MNKLMKTMSMTAVLATALSVNAALEGLTLPKAARIAGGVAAVANHQTIRPMMPENATLAVAVSTVEGGPFQKFKEFGEKAFKKALASGDFKGSEMEKFLEFMKESKLENATFKWAAVSLGEISDLEAFEKNPEFCIAIGVDHDFDQIIPALKKTTTAPATIKEITILGRKALEMTDGGHRFYMTSFDGQAIVFASSRQQIIQQSALYAGGTLTGAKLLAVSPTQPVIIRTMPIGEAIKRFSVGDTSVIDQLNANMPGLGDIAGRLGDLAFSVSSSRSGGDMLVKATLATGSSADAETLKQLADQGLAALKAQLEQAAASDPDAEAAYNVVKSVKVEKNGAKLNLTITVPIKDVLAVLDAAMDSL